MFSKKGLINVIIFIIFIIVILSNIFIFNFQKTTKSIDNSLWIKNTKEILLDSQNIDGGFYILNNERIFSLYETKYIFEILNKYNYPINTTNEMEKILRNNLNSIQLNSLIDLLNLEYITSIFKTLNIKYSSEEKNNIKEKIIKLQDNDGLFHLKKEDNFYEVINSTELFLNIIKNIEIEFDNKELTNTILGLYNGMSYNGMSINNLDKYKYTVFNSLNNIDSAINLNYYQTNKGLELKTLLFNDADYIFKSKPNNKNELINDIALLELVKDLGWQGKPSKLFIDYINSIRLSDGGFNILDSYSSDVQITLRVNSFYDGVKKQDIKNYIDNLSKYQLSNGLYAARNDISSDVKSSYMAFKILDNLKLNIPTQLLNYLNNESRKEHSKIDMYYLSMANIITTNQNSNETSFSIKNITDLYILLNQSNKEEIDKSKILNEINKLKNEDGSFGFQAPDLEVTKLVVEILNKYEISQDLSTTRSWILNLQKNDGGFGIKENSDLIDTHNSIYILDYLDCNDFNYDLLTKYLNDYKLASGGYTFIKGGNPSLYATYYGTEIERILNKSNP